ncbi:MAG: MarR family transcriptional regulator [Microlunatus sp.]|nr:MarR family transcriptional regulator [Microlunatus sp.]
MIEQPEESPGFLLWHLTLRWQREVAAALKPLDLTHVQFVLLASAWWLNSHDQQPTQAALAAHAGTDVKMTSQVIRTLERKGLITRDVDAADTRARRLVVTAAGTNLAPRAIEVVETVDRALLQPLTPNAARAFIDGLYQLQPAAGSTDSRQAQQPTPGR